MEVQLHTAGKRFGPEWIFCNLSAVLQQGHRYAITGPNGSGKSTLLRVLAGYLSLSKGKVYFRMDGMHLPADQVYAHVSWAAPYIELIEEFTLEEALRFHMRFRPFVQDISLDQALALIQLTQARNKQIRYFSSGMKQRLKLGLALLSRASLILLDEPTTNLDEAGAQWYHQMVARFGLKRTIVVASNVPADYSFCTAQINILDYKKKVSAHRHATP